MVKLDQVRDDRPHLGEQVGALVCPRCLFEGKVAQFYKLAAQLLLAGDLCREVFLGLASGGDLGGEVPLGPAVIRRLFSELFLKGSQLLGPDKVVYAGQAEALADLPDFSGLGALAESRKLR